MLAPFQFRPRARLLEFMRQTGDPELINLAAGLPSTLSVPKQELAEIFQTTFRDHADEALGYHVPDGDVELRKILATRFRRRGIDVDWNEMVITTGCTQALHGMIRLLAKPGEIVAFEAPAYYATVEMLGDLGIRALPVPVRDQDGVDLETLETLFHQYRPRLFVVCSALSNPSGATIPEASRKRLVDLCRQTGTTILEDEIYGELSELEDLKPLRAFDDGTAVSYVTSFSKTVAPGLRIGVCVPGGQVDAFAQLKCQQDMHSATLCEVAFRKYLELGTLDSQLAYLRDFNRSRRELGLSLIRDQFPVNTKIWEPSGGFLLWVEIPGALDIGSIYRQALEQKVTFCRGGAFYPDNGPEPAAMRLNCSRPTEEQLVRGLTLLGGIIRDAVR